MTHLWTRREAVAALLGWQVAMTGCGGRGPEKDIEEKIVGPAVGLGHKIRDGGRIEPAEDAWEDVPVVIVGGGVAGLTAAWRLKGGGCDKFVLLELESTAGGTARSDSSQITAYPWGAHYVPAPQADNHALLRLLADVGAVEGWNEAGEPMFAESCLCRAPEERVFYKGRWYEGLYLHVGANEQDRTQLAAFLKEVEHWAAWRDGRGRKAFALPLAASSDDAEVTELDRLSMGEWLNQRGWNSPRLRWLIDYSCRDDYGLTLDQTSAWAGLFYFAARIQHSALEPQPLLTWPEGNGRLVHHLADQVAGHIRLNHAVADIRPQQGLAEAQTKWEVLALVDQGKRAVGFRAEQVIFAAPQFMARHLLQPYRERPPAHLNSFTYGSWLVANLFLHSRPQDVGVPMAWDNVLYESQSLGYVSATHQAGADHGPTVWTYYFPFCDADPRAARTRLLQQDWATCADVVLSDLSMAHRGLRPLVERLDVMRWGHAMVRPEPGFLWGPHRRVAQAGFHGIQFAHCDLSGLPLFEEAFYHGLRAAEAVLERQGELKSWL